MDTLTIKQEIANHNKELASKRDLYFLGVVMLAVWMI